MTRSPARPPARPPARMHARTRARTHARTHARARTHTHTRTRAHTHSHTGWMCKECGPGHEPRARNKARILKSLHTVTFQCKNTRALTFQNATRRKRLSYFFFFRRKQAPFGSHSSSLLDPVSSTQSRPPPSWSRPLLWPPPLHSPPRISCNPLGCKSAATAATAATSDRNYRHRRPHKRWHQNGRRRLDSCRPSPPARRLHRCRRLHRGQPHRR